MKSEQSQNHNKSDIDFELLLKLLLEIKEQINHQNISNLNPSTETEVIPSTELTNKLSESLPDQNQDQLNFNTSSETEISSSTQLTNNSSESLPDQNQNQLNFNTSAETEIIPLTQLTNNSSESLLDDNQDQLNFNTSSETEISSSTDSQNKLDKENQEKSINEVPKISNDDVKSKIKYLENQVEDNLKQITIIMPLISELLRIKVKDSRDSLIKALVPIIDKIVTLKAEQNLNEISLALADIIAPAIQAEINKNPRKIGKAIGPEIALAIQEQIQIDAEAISNTLAPQISPAIKKQILLEKDAMIDALYPVIGNTIAKYLSEVIKDINNKVEHSLSFAGIKRKIKAKIEGVSEAELIFRESIKFTVQAVFLIHKTSGLVIKEVQTSSEHQLDSNMLAGMLTAIRSFANDCIAEYGDFSELAEIEYGESKIILEAAGYCYLALIIKGEPSQNFFLKIRNTLSQIVLQYGQIIKEFNGDPAPIPQSIEFLLADLIETEKKEDNNGFPIYFIIVLCLILGLVFVPLGIFRFQELRAKKIEQTIYNALDSTPEISIYRLNTMVKKNNLTLKGKVPNEYLKNKAETISSILKPELNIDNQIIAVNIPPDPVLATQEVERVTKILNQQSGVDIITNFNNKTVTITGVATDQAEAEKISFAFEQIPGVNSVINTLQTKIPQLPIRIYFELNDNQLIEKNNKINQVKDFLLKNPQVNVRIIGHSDSLGTLSERKNLARKRAITIRDALVQVGISQSRLVIYASTEFPPGVTKEQPLELSRCVRFETFK